MQPSLDLVGSEARVCFAGTEFPCRVIQNIEVNFTQDKEEVRGLCGLDYNKYQTPGVEVVVTFNRRNNDFMKKIFPHLAADGATPADCGGLRISALSCGAGAVQAQPLNIHPLCETNNCNDITIWAAEPSLDFTVTYAEDEAESIEVTFSAIPAPNLLPDGTANPHAGEVAWLGTPELDQDLVFNCTTSDYA